MLWCFGGAETDKTGKKVIPQHRIAEGRGVAERVAEGLTVRLTLRLELGEELPRLVPGLRVLVGARLLEPRPPVGDGVPDDRMRHGEPAAADVGRRRPDVVEAALGPGQRRREIADVDELAPVELRPVVEHDEDVGAGPRLDRGGDARLQVVRVDRLEHDLGAERLGGLRHLALELDVRLGNEVDPTDPVELRPLRVGGRATRRDDAFDAAHRDRRRGTRCRDELPAIQPLRVHA